MKILIINNKKDYFVSFEELVKFIPNLTKDDIINNIQNENEYRIIRKKGKVEILVSVKEANNLLKIFGSNQYFFTPQYREYDISNKYY